MQSLMAAISGTWLVQTSAFKCKHFVCKISPKLNDISSIFRNSLYYDTILLVRITKRSILNTKRLRRSHSPTFKICGKVRLSHLNLIIGCWINTRIDNRLGYFLSIIELIAHQKMPNLLEVPLDPKCAFTSKFSHPSDIVMNLSWSNW